MFNRSATRISLIYLVICIIWIISTDYLLSLYVKDLSEMVSFQVIKGITFLSGTSVLLYFLISRTQSSISESEAKYRQIVETAYEGVWVIDENNITTFVNNRMAEMLGYEKKEMLGKEAFDFVHNEDVPDGLRQIEERKYGKKDLVEFRLKKKQGGYISALMSANPIIEGDSYKGAISLVTDITELRKAEQQLALTQTNLTHLINNTNDLMWSIDSQYRLLSCNNAYEKRIERFSGRKVNSGDPVFISEFGKDVIEEWKRIYSKALAGEHLEFIQRNAEDIQEININPIKDENENIIGAACFSRDITEKVKRDKQEFNAILKAEEKERNRIARELHDGLGQYLTAIKLKLHYILSGKQWPAALVQGLEIALEHVQSASSEATRISVNLLPKNIENSNLLEAIKDLEIIKDSDVSFSFYWNKGARELTLPEESTLNLFRIAQEAIHNIIKHAEAKTATIQLNRQDDQLILCIEDDGKGFDFKRSAHKNGHFGLQNIISRAKALDADIEFDTSPGKGCCLTLLLPLPESSEQKHYRSDAQISDNVKAE